MRRIAATLVILAAALPCAAATVTDPSGIVSFDAPGEWKPFDELTAYNAMQGWDGRLDIGGESTWVRIHLQRRNRYARAALALEVPYFPTDEIFIDERRRTGDGFAEVVTRPQKDGADRGWLEYRHAVEANGMVYLVTFDVGSMDADAVEAALRPILDSIVAKSGMESAQPAPRDGWWTREIEGFVVVSDVKQKARAQAIARKAAIARKIVAKQLGGEPFDDSKPIIWAFADSVSYETFVKKNGSDPKLEAIFASQSRILAVELAREQGDVANASYWDVIRRQAAYQYTWQFYGGAPPTWVGVGMAYYGAIGAESGGKGDKPRTWYVKKGQEVVQTLPRLDEFFTIRWSEIDDVTRVGYELWAWHYFLLHSRGNKASKALYATYMSVLRATGSPRLAKAAFDGCDYDALRIALLQFAEKWR